MLDPNFILRDTLKMLARAACVYLAFFAIYTHEANAGYCVTFKTIYTHANSFTGSSLVAEQLPVYTSVASYASCPSGPYVPTGSEFNTANGVPSSIQTDINTLNSNINTVNTNVSNLTTTVTGIGETATEALTVASQALNAGGGGNSSDPNNILNITPEDAQTLLYATLGLLVAAYVGRMLRRAVDSQPSYLGD